MNGYTFRINNTSNPDVITPGLYDEGQGKTVSQVSKSFNADGTYWWHMRSWGISPNQPGRWESRQFSIDTSQSSSDGVELCDGTNYGSPCQLYTYPGNNNACVDLGSMRDRVASLRFKGSYVGGQAPGQYQAIMYDNQNCDSYLDRVDRDRPTFDGLNDRFASMHIERNPDRPPTPNPPSLVSPASGTTFGENQAITLSWSATGDEYYGEISGGPGGMLTFGWQGGTAKDIGTQWSGYTYSWHVKARNGGGESNWSDTWTFSVQSRPHETQDPSRWFGQYWDNQSLAGSPAVEVNEGNGSLEHRWGLDGPGWGLPSDQFSTRFQRTVNLGCGTYRFNLSADDGVRFWVDGVLQYERWSDGGFDEPARDIALTEGNHIFKLEHYENAGAALLVLNWQLLTPCAQATIPTLTSPADASYLSEGQPITLSWSGTGDEYYGEVRGVPGGTIAFGWQSGTTYTFTPPAAGYTLYWQVKARKAGSESAWSSTREAYVVPATPTNLSGQVLACDQVRLSWTDTSNAEDSFQIYRDGVFIGSSGNLAANVTTVTLSAASNTTHAYTVQASRGIYPSAPSNSVSLTTPACATVPPNDAFPGTTIGALPTHLTATTSNTTTQSGEPTNVCGNRPIGKTVWYSFTPNFPGALTFDTSGSGFDTLVVVYTGTAIDALTPVPGACDDDSGDGLASRVTFNATAFTTYRVQVGGYNSLGGSLVVDFAAAAPPSTYALTTTYVTTGTIDVSPLPGPYAAGTVVTVTAAPYYANRFTGWTVDGVAAGAANPLTLTMNANHSVAASFETVTPPSAFLRATPNPTLDGTVTVSWNTGVGVDGLIFAYKDGQDWAEAIPYFAAGAAGSRTVTGLVTGVAYRFEFFADLGRPHQIATVTVTRANQTPPPAPTLVVPPPSAEGSVGVARNGNQATLTANSASGYLFVGWHLTTTAVQSQAFQAGDRWANPLTLTLVADTTVTAAFVPWTLFNDVPDGRSDTNAIRQLAARGLIRGYGDGRFGPDDGVSRAQMAALIARAMAQTSADPAHLLSPPACIVANSWDCEDWGNDFADRSGDPNLWRNIGTLRHYGVAYGLDGVNFAPNAPVTYAQTISFITRAMVAKGYWQQQTGTPTPYRDVPGPHAGDVATFYFYTQAFGGIPAPPADWNTGASRGWFARALWQALDSTFGH